VTSGAIRKQRGVKPGVPDDLVWCRGKSICIAARPTVVVLGPAGVPSCFPTTSGAIITACTNQGLERTIVYA